MNVALTPFLRRSLRTHCRSGKTYLIRGGMLLAMLASVASAQMTAGFMGAPGLFLFGSILWISAFLICLGGPAYFASIITEEKEQMTLGLLKMTGLRPVSILLGKSTSQMLGAIALLLVQVPFTVLSITLGGVSLPQVMAGYLALLAHLIFVTNLALLCSVVCRRGKRAATLTAVFLLAFYCGARARHVAWTRVAGALWLDRHGTRQPFELGTAGVRFCSSAGRVDHRILNLSR